MIPFCDVAQQGQMFVTGNGGTGLTWASLVTNQALGTCLGVHDPMDVSCEWCQGPLGCAMVVVSLLWHRQGQSAAIPEPHVASAEDVLSILLELHQGLQAGRKQFIKLLTYKVLTFS